jgi:hypothetical protein
MRGMPKPKLLSLPLLFFAVRFACARSEAIGPRSRGIAISLCDGAERALLRNIEKLTRLQLPTLDRRSALPPPPRRVETLARWAPQNRHPDKSEHSRKTGTGARASRRAPIG